VLGTTGVCVAAVGGGFFGITMLIGTIVEPLVLACGPTFKPPVAPEPAAAVCGNPVGPFIIVGPVTEASELQPINATRPIHRALVRSVVIFQPFKTSLSREHC
jgi:hypothetical protein